MPPAIKQGKHGDDFIAVTFKEAWGCAKLTCLGQRFKRTVVAGGGAARLVSQLKYKKQGRRRDVEGASGRGGTMGWAF